MLQETQNIGLKKNRSSCGTKFRRAITSYVGENRKRGETLGFSLVFLAITPSNDIFFQAHLDCLQSYGQVSMYLATGRRPNELLELVYRGQSCVDFSDLTSGGKG